MSTHILVVDDEKELADVLELYLVNDGCTIHKCYTGGAEALDCLAHTDLDLALLDVMLPDADGFQLCKKIREKSYCPIIMLTARGSDGDKIMGLTIGADDYITKPFNPLEVVARVKTQLRRYRLYNGSAPKQEEPAHEYDIRGPVLNRNSHKCFLFGREVQLTPLEFSIRKRQTSQPQRRTAALIPHSAAARRHYVVAQNSGALAGSSGTAQPSTVRSSVGAVFKTQVR